MDTHTSADAVVRTIVTRVDRQRRAGGMTRRLWRVALVAAAAVLLLALVGRLRGWSPVLPLSVGGVVTVGVTAFARIGRRGDVSDGRAARMDADANLGGELRSAFWFASQPLGDAWVAFHVDRAAERLRAVDWARLYPHVPATASRVATATLALAAVALAMSGFWHRPGGSSAIVTRAGAPVTGPTLVALPADVRKHLEDLLAAIERGELSADAARARTAELRDVMSRIDPSLDLALADLGKRTPAGSVVGAAQPANDAAQLAARAEHAAARATGLPADVRWSLEDLASRLANSASASQPADASATASAGKSEESGGSSSQTDANALADAAKAGLLMRETAPDPAANQMMMAGVGAAGGDSGLGVGHADLKSAGAGQLLDLEQALRRETVDASADAAGANVIAEARRKTEQGRATVAFTHAAAATFDASHGTHRPQVPEDRRALVGQYFVRVPRF